MTMVWRNAQLLNGLAMSFRRIPYIASPPITWKYFCQQMHLCISVRLGQHRGSCNGSQVCITFNYALMWYILIGQKTVAINKL